MRKKYIHYFVELYKSSLVNKIILAFIIFCTIGWSYYYFLFPMIEKYRYSERSTAIETDILYDMHNIYGNRMNVEYFNVFALVGGDRIYIIRANNRTIARYMLIDNIKKNDWCVTEKNEHYVLNKEKYKGVLKINDNKDTLMLGYIDTIWGDLWYKLYELYFFDFSI